MTRSSRCSLFNHLHWALAVACSLCALTPALAHEAQTSAQSNPEAAFEVPEAEAQFSELPIDALLARDEPASPVPDRPSVDVPSIPVPADNGYWIVSTESSPQSFDETLPRFCAQVTRYEDGSGLRKSSLQELTSSLNPGLPICIMVHGSLVDSPSVLPESQRTWKWLRHGAADRPFHMIYFRWPSYRILSPLVNIDFAVLGRRASRNGFYLAGLIQSLPAESPVALLGHSHGTRVISSALHLMAGGSVENIACQQLHSRHPRIRAVFTASAIDHDWLNPGERFGRALCSTECLLNLKNAHDPALLIYPLRRIASRRALGNTGFTAADRKALGSFSSKVRDIDVSDVIGCRHIWPAYTNQPRLVHQASPWLFPTSSTP